MKAGDFTEQAAVYGRARPTYPASLVDAIVRDANVELGDPVADIGAGTGIFTQLLTDRGFRVTAVEPNTAMRESAIALQGVKWRDGTFEATGLPDATFQWVVAAQAFHWADPTKALPELRRILRDGGAFTVLWNYRDQSRSDVLRWTHDAVKRHVPEFDPTQYYGKWDGVLTSTGDFRDVIRRRTEHSVAMSAMRYLDLWRSNNLLNATAGSERFAKFFAELEEFLQKEKIDEIDVTYCCEAWTAPLAAKRPL